MTGFSDKYERLEHFRKGSWRYIAGRHKARAKSFENLADSQNRILCLNGYEAVTGTHDVPSSNSYKEDPVYQIISRVNVNSIDEAIQGVGLKYVSGGKGVEEKKEHRRKIRDELSLLRWLIKDRKLTLADYEVIFNSKGNEWLQGIAFDAHPRKKRLERELRSMWFSPNYETGNEFLDSSVKFYNQLSDSEKKIMVNYINRLIDSDIPINKGLIKTLLGRLS